MANGSGPYLVQRREDGYGDVVPLQVGLRTSLGRATTNRIVLKDELSSREHAEVYFAEEHWLLRDLKSLNGTRVNGTPLESEHELVSGDQFQVGHTSFVFVANLDELPPLSSPVALGDGVSIRQRLGQTRFLTPLPENKSIDGTTPSRHTLSRDLSKLYRLALEMGSAETEQELARIVLAGLLETVPADSGAILALDDDRDLQVLAHKNRNSSSQPYLPLSEYVTSEVLASKEAILAEDTRYNGPRDNNLTPVASRSLICAPVLFGSKILGLIHLYGTDPHRNLTAEDLEFTVALAKQLGTVTHQTHRQESLSAQNQALRAMLRADSELIGESEVISAVLGQIRRVADTNATVLVRGESGVGKELVARAIHQFSQRKEGPFITLNCAAIAETLLESELFGHERGAFTGATEKKIGKFEAAHHGSIFLDEIGEMSMTTQAKLLRVIEGHTFERVGGGTPIRVSVRIIAATNQPLERAIQEGKFRRDLFFRLRVVEIHVAPLRERKSDIRVLADYFFKRFISETGRRIRGISAEALRKMEDYDWPGNVRELRNVIERAVALGHGPILDVHDISLSGLELSEPSGARQGNEYVPQTLEVIERGHILQTLEYTDWNKSQAATILSIERSTLDRKIKGYQLKREPPA